MSRPRIRASSCIIEAMPNKARGNSWPSQPAPPAQMPRGAPICRSTRCRSSAPPSSARWRAPTATCGCAGRSRASAAPHSSGHCYFGLKDDKSKIEAVIWRTTVQGLRFKPAEGLEVIATGRITTYPGSSNYQIVIDALEPAGIGALMALLEERKKKLAAEGLFDEARKKPRPFLPRVIGIVTSPTGAVIRDMLAGFTERFPAHVLVWPVRVQGETCAAEVAAAIRGFNALAGGRPHPAPRRADRRPRRRQSGGPVGLQRRDGGARRRRQRHPAHLRRRPRDRLDAHRPRRRCARPHAHQGRRMGGAEVLRAAGADRQAGAAARRLPRAGRSTACGRICARPCAGCRVAAICWRCRDSASTPSTGGWAGPCSPTRARTACDWPAALAAAAAAAGGAACPHARPARRARRRRADASLARRIAPRRARLERIAGRLGLQPIVVRIARCNERVEVLAARARRSVLARDRRPSAPPRRLRQAAGLAQLPRRPAARVRAGARRRGPHAALGRAGRGRPAARHRARRWPRRRAGARPAARGTTPSRSRRRAPRRGRRRGAGGGNQGSLF